MAYVRPNFKTKKELRTALACGVKVEVFEPGLGAVPPEGPVQLEGPWYPAHTWYAEGTMKDGQLIKIR